MAFKRPSYIDPGTPLLFAHTEHESSSSSPSPLTPDFFSQKERQAAAAASPSAVALGAGLGLSDPIFHSRVHLEDHTTTTPIALSSSPSKRPKSWRGCSRLVPRSLHPLALLPAFLLGMTAFFFLQSTGGQARLAHHKAALQHPFSSAAAEVHPNGHLYIASREVQDLQEHPIEGLIRNATQQSVL